MDTAERAQAMAQRDLYSTLFVVSLVVVGGLCAWIVKLTLDLSKANDVARGVMEARVADQKESKREYSLTVDKNSEALTLVLAMTRARAQARRTEDTPPKGGKP